MFCRQCEQTSNQIACTKLGICGKQPDVAVLQDLLLYALQGLSSYAKEALKEGKLDNKVNKFTIAGLLQHLQMLILMVKQLRILFMKQ